MSMSARGSIGVGGASGFEASLAKAVPILIIGYAVALLALRLSLSPFLEIDEAQFVGQVDWRLVYANSHPPLYNWALRGLLEATGWNWPLSTGLLKYALLCAYYLLAWDAARRLGGPMAGMMAVAAAAFLPQIVWQSAHTLAHSIMVLTGSMAIGHAVILIWERPSLGRYVWLGAAAALGALAKFNFFLFAAPLMLVIALEPEARRRVFERPAWIALALFIVATTPSFIAAALDLEASAGRLSKLYSSSEGPWYDPPWLGLDGFVSLLVASIAWAGPLAMVWALARWRSPREVVGALPNAAPLRLLARAMALGMIAFALIVLAADMHKVHERYLTPILAVAPVWLAARYPLGGAARRWVAGLAGVAFLGALIGVFAMVSNEKHRYAIPYQAIAAEIERAGAPPAPILAARHSDVANLTLALGWRGAAAPRYAAVEDRALLVWRGDRSPPMRLAPEGFAPEGEPTTVRASYLNWRHDAFVMSFQSLKRP
ncbi:MAG: glycosyltransferase family 39 protein [Pseudomonadota bacterium]